MRRRGDELMRVDEVAYELGVRISNVYRLIGSGQLTHVVESSTSRAGVKVRVARSALDDYVERSGPSISSAQRPGRTRRRLDP